LVQKPAAARLTHLRLGSFLRHNGAVGRRLATGRPFFAPPVPVGLRRFISGRWKGPSQVIAMFEPKSKPLLPRRQFYGRMARSVAAVAGIVGFSLLLGSAGYHGFGGVPWIDALLNASMILTGMGPVDPMKTVAAKLFATFYALYSGIAFLTIVAVLMAPLFHRFLHKFHLEVSETELEDEDKKDDQR
jgi:hypothetical protein